MSGTVRAAVAGRGGQRASVRERAGREGAGGNEFLYIGLHSNLKLVLGELLSLTALILQLLVAFVKKKKNGAACPGCTALLLLPLAADRCSDPHGVRVV